MSSSVVYGEPLLNPVIDLTLDDEEMNIADEEDTDGSVGSECEMNDGEECESDDDEDTDGSVGSECEIDDEEDTDGSVGSECEMDDDEDEFPTIDLTDDAEEEYPEIPTIDITDDDEDRPPETPTIYPTDEARPEDCELQRQDHPWVHIGRHTKVDIFGGQVFMSENNVWERYGSGERVVKNTVVSRTLASVQPPIANWNPRWAIGVNFRI